MNNVSKDVDWLFRALNIKVVIFDFDGTLFKLNVNWKKLKNELSEYLLKKYNLKVSFNPLLEGLDFVQKNYNDSLINELYNIIAKFECSAECIPITKSIYLLKNFKKYDKKIAIFSSNTKKVISRCIKKYRLSNFVDLIIALEDVKLHKPNPEGIFMIMRYFNVKKDEIIIIGDSNKDFLAGQEAGIKVYDIHIIVRAVSN